jgi:hypothetical protein
MNLSRSLPCAALVALLFSATAATAGDNKVYPGSACLPMNQSQAYSLAFLSFYNTSSTVQWVYCPVIRDNLDSKKLLANTTVTVYDASAAGGNDDVRCTLYMVDVAGSTLVLSAASSPTGAANTAQLTLGPLEASVPSSYYIICRLPAAVGANQSRVISYHVDEPS